MTITRSAADEIHRLVTDLSTPSAAARETAAARLSVIGERAVPHLLDGLTSTASAAGRAAILKVLEATGDRRALEPALALVKNPGTESGVALAAIGVVASFLDSEHGSDALEALADVAVDQTAADLLRLASLDALSAMPARAMAPLRKRLGSDPSAAVRARAASAPALPRIDHDPISSLDAVASGGSADPAGLKVLVNAAAATAPLPSLHRLVESIRTREQAARTDLDRAEWQEIRGLVHVALASRGSRVAVYDLRETLEEATGALPSSFLTALARIGDRSCLEPAVGALARATRSPKAHAEWKKQLLSAARAIVQREALTRRHGVVRRVIARWPEAAADLLDRPGQ